MFPGHLFSAVTQLKETDLKAEDMKRLSKSLRRGFWAQKKTLLHLSESMRQNLTRVVDLENGLDTIKEEVENRIQEINATVVNCCQNAGKYC